MAPRPRGRPRKRPITRMDAAIDAMKPFGFPHNVVVQTLKGLQTVYGEDGWAFIEDASYKVLLEAILEKVNGEETSDSKRPAAEPETLGGTVEPSSSSVQPPDTALQSSNVLDPAPETNGGVNTEMPTNESNAENLPSAEAGGSKSKHVQSPWSLSHPTPSPPPTHNSPLPTSNSTGQRSRKPYHGWIDSDDDGEDLLVLKPGPWGDSFEDWVSSLRPPLRERRSRWDLRPEDM